MSAQATGYVFERSPYTGAGFAVHLAIADSVNDLHGHEFWLRARRLARKARVSRDRALAALEQLVQDGFLELIERGGGRSKPSRYRFLFPDAAVVYSADQNETVESHDPFQTVGSRPETVESRREKVVSHDRHRTQEEPKLEQEPKTRAATLAVVIPGGKRVVFAEEPFEAFWTAYPRKVGKGEARKAWAKRLEVGADPLKLISGARTFGAWVIAAAECGEIESMRFVAHPATWLNQEREQDQLTVPGRAPASGSKVEQAKAEWRKRYGPGNGEATRRPRDGRVGLADGSGSAGHVDGGLRRPG